MPNRSRSRSKSSPRDSSRIVFIPSVSGGLGHITRTLRLARELERQRDDLCIEYVLDRDRLRENNVKFAESTGYPVQLLPPRGRDSRDVIIRALLGDADLVIDDTTSYLVPYRRLIGAKWVTMPMYPLADELFMSWPLMMQADRILWTYPAAMGIPEELQALQRKVFVSGPILGAEELPSRAEGRRTLNFRDDELILYYSPRGMPFGRDFGERLLASLVNGFIQLRKKYPTLRLVLTGVRDKNELRFPGMPADARRVRGLDVRGILSPQEIRALTAGADVTIAEGTTTTFEAIAAGTPLLMVPGAIYETWLLGTRLHAADAAVIEWIERVTPATMAAHLDRIISGPARTRERTERARKFLGEDGGAKAAKEILRLLDAR